MVYDKFYMCTACNTNIFLQQMEDPCLSLWEGSVVVILLPIGICDKIIQPIKLNCLNLIKHHLQRRIFTMAFATKWK
jgi:hypothetical protein